MYDHFALLSYLEFLDWVLRNNKTRTWIIGGRLAGTKFTKIAIPDNSRTQTLL